MLSELLKRAHVHVLVIIHCKSLTKFLTDKRRQRSTVDALVTLGPCGTRLVPTAVTLHFHGIVRCLYPLGWNGNRPSCALRPPPNSPSPLSAAIHRAGRDPDARSMSGSIFVSFGMRAGCLTESAPNAQATSMIKEAFPTSCRQNLGNIRKFANCVPSASIVN